MGFVLGPLGLGWSLLAGSVCALLHRIWLQRRRGRSFRRGYCPLGPGMIAGAMMVFLFVNAGGSLAADRGTPWYGRDALAPPPLLPAPIETAIGTAALAATELAPARMPLPPSLAAREVAVDEAKRRSPSAAVTERIATLAGVPVAVEERPARVAGGALSLDHPPETSLTFTGQLVGLLNRAAARSGYDWTWADGAIIFYRYWDVDQRYAAVSDIEFATVRPSDAAVSEGAETWHEVAAATWTVDRARHPTLRDVLEEWGRAGRLVGGVEAGAALRHRRRCVVRGRVPGCGRSAARGTGDAAIPGGARPRTQSLPGHRGRGGRPMSPRPWPSLLAACAIALFATSCTPFWTDAQEMELAPPAAVRPDPAETRLAEAAERAEAALTMLARIRAAEVSLPVARAPSRGAARAAAPGDHRLDRTGRDPGRAPRGIRGLPLRRSRSAAWYDRRWSRSRPRTHL